jgi:hypothetical protein
MAISNGVGEVMAEISCDEADFVKTPRSAEAAMALLNWRRLRVMSFLSVGLGWRRLADARSRANAQRLLRALQLVG